MLSKTTFLLVAALTAALTACQPERASVEDLYTARMLGLSYLQRNQLAEAESEFKKIVQLAPDDPLGYANLGLTYLQAGRYAEAEKQLLRARELDPSSVEVGLALARLYSLTGRVPDARELLGRLRRDSTGHAPVLFALAEIEASQSDVASARRYEELLRDLLVIAPANLPARLKLVDALARRGESDSAVRHLEEVRRIPPEPPREARAYLDSSIQLLRAGMPAEARRTIDRLIGLMEVTSPYQAALEEVRWPEGPIPGRPILTFAPKDFISLRGTDERTSVALAKFTDATTDAGFAGFEASAGATARGAPTAIAAADVDGDGTDDLFVSAWSAAARKTVTSLFRFQGGMARDATAHSTITLTQGATYAT
ncbi:MAG: tetratricopeptide repeat protein, partial [Gemmatimonadota bacterium]|nr:tetratricopeptide repeat protein [Gemmatimonadota bacterium]